MRIVAGAVAVMLAATARGPAAQSSRRINVAHRGASAYAPEHTLAAYRLALEQGADFVEQDLAEIKTLDAGAWFDAKFAGERVPTFDEAVALIRGKAGL